MSASEYEKVAEGIQIRKGLARRKIDCFVFDIDGVLIDVTQSFRKAIVETVKKYCGLVGIGKVEFGPEEVRKFKNAGSFNDDWELTYAAVLYFILKKNGAVKGLEEYLKMVVEHGEGIVGAKKVAVKCSACAEDIEKFWDVSEENEMNKIFEEFYFGKLYSKVYNEKNEYYFDEGFVETEKALVSKSLLDNVPGKLGAFTGRTKAETDYGLNRIGIARYFDCLVCMEDVKKKKPDPEGLVKCIERMKCKKENACYIGDGESDVRAAKSAGVLFIAVINGVADEKLMKKLEAEVILENTSDLLDAVKYFCE
ncbi:Pyrophosphatase PpaX [Candidatus Gugararchaeum adminiculabundum]|nr:Pyrophosphatase PpaX [Candidatus Gugararchaeum adminiculabundum]